MGDDQLGGLGPLGGAGPLLTRLTRRPGRRFKGTRRDDRPGLEPLETEDFVFELLDAILLGADDLKQLPHQGSIFCFRNLGQSQWHGHILPTAMPFFPTFLRSYLVSPGNLRAFTASTDTSFPPGSDEHSHKSFLKNAVPPCIFRRTLYDGCFDVRTQRGGIRRNLGLGKDHHMSNQNFIPTSSGRQRIKHSMRHGLIVGLALTLPSGMAWAGGGGGGSSGSAPEIDPTVSISGLTVLTGALLLIADRVRKSRARHR